MVFNLRDQIHCWWILFEVLRHGMKGLPFLQQLQRIESTISIMFFQNFLNIICVFFTQQSVCSVYLECYFSSGKTVYEMSAQKATLIAVPSDQELLTLYFFLIALPHSTPTGNSLSAAELTCGMIMSLAR